MIKIYDNKEPNQIKGEVNSEKEAFNFLSRFIDSINFNSYYIRVNVINESKVWLDYGSHTHFVYFETSDGSPIRL